VTDISDEQKPDKFQILTERRNRRLIWGSFVVVWLCCVTFVAFNVSFPVSSSYDFLELLYAFRNK